MWVWPPQQLEGVVSDEGTVVQLQHLQRLEAGPAHQVTDTAIRDPLAVRESLEEGGEERESYTGTI